jgi:hypothetical protein
MMRSRRWKRIIGSYRPAITEGVAASLGRRRMRLLSISFHRSGETLGDRVGSSCCITIPYQSFKAGLANAQRHRRAR